MVMNVGHRTSLTLYVWLILSLVQSFSVAEAALVVLPSGEPHSLMWERVLIVYDSLSKQQTVIGEAAVSSSPSQFAVLIATPKNAVINYTTTRIWRKLRPYIKVPERTVRALDLSVDSWLWNRFAFQDQKVAKHKEHIDVLKSRDTQVHIQERALHEWLISRGLSLSPQQALSIKKVYQLGFSVAALHVRPRHKANEALADETWTSTWIFSYEVDKPHYMSLWPSQKEFARFNQKDLAQAHQNNLSSTDKLKLTFISDQALKPKHRSISETEDEQIDGLLKSLDRLQLKALNQSLNAQNWSFNRRGILSHFELNAPLGLQHIRAVACDEKKIIAPPAKLKVQNYKLSIPIEVLLGLILAFTLILKKKSKY